MTILIVEDDRKLAHQLQKGLNEEGHPTSLVFDGKKGLEIATTMEFDVLVLDVMLPGLDGFTLVRRLRQAGVVTPVLMLTARDSDEDIVTGLDAGADDYLTKPFSFRVLLARLRALGRRSQAEPRMRLQVGDLVLDPATHRVQRGAALLPLTRTEFGILDLLMKNAGRVITRERLIQGVWGHDCEIESNTLDVFMRQLRLKVEPEGSRKLIHTVRGVGYTLREEETA
jgi:two-component system copper resistance phosphate regulon response regulator CusR/two-component system response regulator MprA